MSGNIVYMIYTHIYIIIIALAALGNRDIAEILNTMNTLRSNVVPSASNMQTLVSEVFLITLCKICMHLVISMFTYSMDQ